MNGNHHFSCSSTRFDAKIILELDPTYWKYTVAQHNGMIEVLGIRDMLYLHTKKNTGLAILNRIHGLKTRKECRQQHERSGGHVEDVRVIVLSKTRPVSLIRQVYEARHRCFGEKLSSRIHRKGSSDANRKERIYICSASKSNMENARYSVYGSAKGTSPKTAPSSLLPSNLVLLSVI
ncbi:alanine racemase [Tanacetum coccineum]